jgi:hypothetical protein
VREEEEDGEDDDGGADHENATLDSDEEEGEGGGSDYETAADGEEVRRTGLRTPRLDLGSLKPTRVLSGLATPKPGRMMDYFTTKQQPPPEKEKEKEKAQVQDKPQKRERQRSEASQSPMRTPKQADVPLAPEPERHLTDSPVSIRSPGLPAPVATPGRGLGGLGILSDPDRPGLRHQASKSMVDLLSPGRQRGSVFGDDVPTTSAASAAAAEVHAMSSPGSPRPTQPQSPRATLQRRSSMPDFTNPASPPPPYPSFAFPGPMRRGFTRIQPRDDEGMEVLPKYSNSIHLVAIMPRKMEFESAGVQARDRKWRR